MEELTPPNSPALSLNDECLELEPNSTSFYEENDLSHPCLPAARLRPCEKDYEDVSSFNLEEEEQGDEDQLARHMNLGKGWKNPNIDAETNASELGIDQEEYEERFKEEHPHLGERPFREKVELIPEHLSEDSERT